MTEGKTGMMLQSADGTIQSCDRTAEELLGYTAQQLVGIASFDSAWQAIRPDGSKIPLEQYPAIVALESGKPCRDVIMGFYQPDGELVWLSVNATPLFQANHSTPHAVITTLSEILSPIALQTSITSAKLGMWFWDIETDTLVWTERCKALFGLPLNDAAIAYADFLDVLHPEDRDRTHEAVIRTMQDREDFDIEYRAVWEDGSVRWIAAKGSCVHNAIGKAIRMNGVVIDIDDRKRAELNDQFLHQLETRLRHLSTAKAMVEAVVSSVGEYLNVELCLWHEIDLDRRVAIVDHTWQRGNIPNLTGTYDLDVFFTPKQLETYAAGQPLIVCDVTTDPDTALYAQNYLSLGVSAFVSVPCIQSDRWVACLSVDTERARSWRLDEVALLQEVVSRLWSVIEYTRTVEELRQKNAILSVINESAPTPIFVKDRQGRIIYANPATLEVFGKTAAEVIGYRDCDLYPNPEDAARVMENDRRIMESGQIEVVEESPDGIRTFLGMKAPYRNAAGEVIGLIGISNDISDRVQLERDRERILRQEQAARETAESANRIKDEFLAVVSHELRTPLNPILGWSRLLQQGKLDAAKTANALATIERNAHLQSQLIDDLLDISRILRGKLSLHRLPVDLRTVIESALETVRLAAEAKLLHIQTNIGAACNVMGDSGRLQQVVWNLLSNAVKFTPQGGRVAIGLSRIGNNAQIQVSDTGKGINSEFLPYVFDHFRQEDSATTRKFGGLGLGLAIARQIVELHGGTIAVESPGENQGATFTVQIPFASELCQLPTAKTASDAKNDLSGIHIFVVDDEPDSREFAAFVLEQAGAIVTSFASGSEVLQAIKQSVPDLIVSDIGMPEMNGYGLMQQIRAGSPASQVSAIALTAYAGEFDRQQALQAGFQQHLAKPIDPDQLLNAIASLCNSHQ